MSDSFKSLIVGTITVATITLFVLPRQDINATASIKAVFQYIVRAVSYAVGGQDIPNISERD